MGSKNQKLNLDRDTLYDLYITQKMTSKEVGEIFDCSSKTIRNYLKLYNIPIRQNGESVKLDRSKWSKEKEQARSLKFMNTWKNTPEDIKKEIIVRRTANSNPPEAIQKARETRIKNNSFIKSKSENAFYDKLCAIFGNNNVLHGYQDNRYPFICDFYIVDKDLFIEYQGHQTHGYEPYDENSIEHEDYLNYMNSRGIDMRTWTERDPKKIQVAKRNNISLLLIYPKHNSYLIKNGNMSNVGKINPIDINDIN